MRTPSEQENWLADFKRIPVEFRPAPFWSWNERMEPDEVRRQIDLMADAGWGGAFLHSRNGLLTPYLQEEWFAAVEAAVDQSRKRGLKVYLYDEDGWPSGFSGGTVPSADPAYRIKTLCARPVGAEPPPGAVPLGEPAHGVQVYAWAAPFGDARYRGLCYTDMLSRAAVRKFIDDAYESYYRRFGRDYGSLIVAEFFDEPRIVEHFGHLPAGPVAYSSDLLPRFHEMHGYDPASQLHLLFVDAPGAARFRLHYYRTVTDLYERNFAGQIGQWCADHGISLTGHFMWEESLFSQQLMGTRIMPAYRQLQIPGIDHLAFQIDEKLTAKQCQSVVNQYGKQRMMSELFGAGGQAMTFEDRWWIASQQLCFGVNFFVPHLALYTMAGGRKHDHPPDLYYQQPWWPMERHLQDALSRLCMALSQGRYYAEALILHPMESAVALWQVQSSHPDGNKLVRRQENCVLPSEARQQIDALDAHLKSVIDTLLAAQRTFDLGDEQILADDAAVEANGLLPLLRVGQMRYPLVIIPAVHTIRPTTFRLLLEFQKAGGQVVRLRCGSSQPLVDGCPDAQLVTWFAAIPSCDVADLPRLARQMVPAAVELSSISSAHAAQLYVHTRDLEDGSRLVYLTNLSRSAEFTATVHFRERGVPWKSVRVLDACSGTLHPIAIQPTECGAAASLSFAPTQCHLLLLSAQEEAIVLPAPLSPPDAHIAIAPDDWQVRRLDDNALPLDYARWRIAGEGAGPGDNWSELPLPVIAIEQALRQERHEGPLELRYEVNVEQLAAARKLLLVVEYAQQYEIRVNGQLVQYQGLPHIYDFRWLPVDVTGMLHAGSNHIALRTRFGTAASPDLGAIYLFGDFSVIGQYLPATHADALEPSSHVHRLARASIRLQDPLPLSASAGDLTIQGLPFYAGRVQYTHQMDSAIGHPAAFTIERLDAAVGEVHVDSQPVGVLMSRPLTVDLSRLPAMPRLRSLQLTLYGTLRNLLGPHHHPSGEPRWVSPDTFAPEAPPTGKDRHWLDLWANGLIFPANWSDDYHLPSFAGIGRSSVMMHPKPQP